MIDILKNLLKEIELTIFKTYQSIISVIKVIILSKKFINLPQGKSDTCYVLGNGPSLNSFLKTYSPKSVIDLFCVNHFPSSDSYISVRPSGCVWLDPAFYFGAHPLAIETIENLILRTAWPLKLYVPIYASKSTIIKKILSRNSNINIVFFNYTLVNGFDFFCNFFFKRNLGMPQCENVIAATIFISINSGFKNIYLMGADHTWLRDLVVKPDNELYLKMSHFYSGTETKYSILKNKGGEKRKITDFLQSSIRAFSTYYILNRYARQIGTHIYNATEDSYIDAFQRKMP